MTDIRTIPARGANAYPPEGSMEEVLMFQKIQQAFPQQFSKAFPDKLAEKTVVIIPSLTLDQQILSKVSGHIHYEERLLCLLMLLRMPRTHVVYISSVPIDPVIIDYYLHLLPGITRHHALKRLKMISCYDASSKSLTEKILERPRVIEKIRSSIPTGSVSHMACFNVTKYERTLAVKLNMPIYGCDPDLFELGNKSNSRIIFKECGLLVPPGFEDLKNEKEIIHALAELKLNNPQLKRAVVKMNDGFSGDGNAVFSYEGINEQSEWNIWIADNIKKKLKIVASDLSYKDFMYKFQSMGGIVEEFLEGNIKDSPSVQCRINPLGDCKVISTHDQEVGGESGQVFMGATFPANEEYASEIGEYGMRVAEAMQKRGVMGRFGVDFISVREGDNWKHYAIEINLRKGGTTHPYILLQFLTDGDYEQESGMYLTANKQTRYYFCSDNLRSERYKGITPPDLIDIAMLHQLHYDGTHQEGVMFHLIGALSQYGKLGVVCIGSSPERARNFYEQTVKVLNSECC
ncbi:MAG TPA: peptide ligase PGM1-related protein [Chitinophagaceae bacterium]|nr:peptide ligase PGM1-related protein [Chitinophagaceae bacterium]